MTRMVSTSITSMQLSDWLTTARRMASRSSRAVTSWKDQSRPRWPSIATGWLTRSNTRPSRNSTESRLSASLSYSAWTFAMKSSGSRSWARTCASRAASSPLASNSSGIRHNCWKRRLAARTRPCPSITSMPSVVASRIVRRKASCACGSRLWRRRSSMFCSPAGTSGPGASKAAARGSDLCGPAYAGQPGSGRKHFQNGADWRFSRMAPARRRARAATRRRARPPRAPATPGRRGPARPAGPRGRRRASHRLRR